MGLVLPHQLPYPFLYPHLNMSLMGDRLETDMKKMGFAHGEIMYFMGEAKEISSGKTWGLGIINSQVSLNPTRQLKPSVSLER